MFSKIKKLGKLLKKCYNSTRSQTTSLKMRFDKIETQYIDIAYSSIKLQIIWNILDPYCDCRVRLTDIDMLIMFCFPVLDSNDALRHAYRFVVNNLMNNINNNNININNDVDMLSFVNPLELSDLLLSIFYFNKIYKLCKDTDEPVESLLDFNEFRMVCNKLEIGLTLLDLSSIFQKFDSNQGDVISFDDFCRWYIKTHIDYEKREQLEDIFEDIFEDN